MIACGCVACAWAVDTDEADERRKRKTYQVRIVDMILCRRGCVTCRHRWWWSVDMDEGKEIRKEKLTGC